MNLNQITIQNIKSFIEGNLAYYMDKIYELPDYLKEQYYYRLYQCKDDCLITGKCKICTCPTLKKAFANKSCNPGVILDLMPGGEWRDYKKENDVSQELLENIKLIIDEQIKSKN